MPSWLKIYLILLSITVTVFALDRLFLWMERRGWIYWRRIKPKGGGIAAGLSAFHELIEPQVREIREEQPGERLMRRSRGSLEKTSSIFAKITPPVADNRRVLACALATGALNRRGASDAGGWRGGMCHLLSSCGGNGITYACRF